MNTKVITKLIENYRNLEKTLVSELEIDGGSNTSSAEEIWQPVFKRIVPTKYSVEKNVYIIDSWGVVSEKVSLAIYDEQYTPYIFNYGTIKYIPIEAVFVVVLCDNTILRKHLTEQYDRPEVQNQNSEQKQETKKHPLDLWLESIQKLKTDMNAYVRIQTGLLETNIDELHKKLMNAKESEFSRIKQNQTSTRPITILCTTEEDYSDPEFDIVLSVCLEKSKTKIFKHLPKEGDKLSIWYEQLNHFNLERYKDNFKKMKELSSKGFDTDRNLYMLNVGTDNALLSLMFQLNQLLVLINNPIFFPHQSYVEAFKGERECKDL